MYIFIITYDIFLSKISNLWGYNNLLMSFIMMIIEVHCFQSSQIGFEIEFFIV